MARIIIAASLVSTSMKSEPKGPSNEELRAAKSKWVPKLEKFMSSVETQLDKIGKRTGKAVYRARTKYNADIEAIAVYKMRIEGAPAVVLTVTVVAPTRATKIGDLQHFVVAKIDSKNVEKKLHLSLKRNGGSVTAAGIAKALKELALKTATKKDRDQTIGEKLIGRVNDSFVDHKRQAEHINSEVGANLVSAKKFSLNGLPQSGVFVRGNSKKVKNLRFNVLSNKFSVSVCPNSFLGNSFETWLDKAFGTKALTQANIEAALKKHGF